MVYIFGGPGWLARIWYLEWQGDISGYGILWRLFGFGRELFWHLDNWIGYEHRAGSQQMFPSRI
jgi:hypothetical protein